VFFSLDKTTYKVSLLLVENSPDKILKSEWTEDWALAQLVRPAAGRLPTRVRSHCHIPLVQLNLYYAHVFRKTNPHDCYFGY
jgi:hypothetical protein